MKVWWPTASAFVLETESKLALSPIETGGDKHSSPLLINFEYGAVINQWRTNYTQFCNDIMPDSHFREK
jgi:hypothetical protein